MSRNNVKGLVNIGRGVFVDINKQRIYCNFNAGVSINEVKETVEKFRSTGAKWVVYSTDVLDGGYVSDYKIGTGKSDTQQDNKATILGLDPAYTICSRVVQVWRKWTITIDGKSVWQSTDTNGDKTISVTLNGKGYNLPAYRVLAIASMIDASTLDKDTYDYLCALIYNEDGKRSSFEVHHIDGNHHNNKSSNLAILHKHDHKEAHKLLNKIATATFNDDPYCVELAKRKYLEFVSIHSSYDYIVNTY